MTEDSTFTVRALAWSSKMRGRTGGEAKWVVVWGLDGEKGGRGSELWKRGRLQWLASIDLPCDAILPPYATGVDHPSATPLSPSPPPPVGVTPLEAEADILKNDSESHRGSHWRFLAGSTRPDRRPSLFFALGLSHSKGKERKSGRATKREKTIAAKDAEINERILVGICVSWLLSLKWWDFRDTHTSHNKTRQRVFITSSRFLTNSRINHRCVYI